MIRASSCARVILPNDNIRSAEWRALSLNPSAGPTAKKRFWVPRSCWSRNNPANSSEVNWRPRASRRNNTGAVRPARSFRQLQQRGFAAHFVRFSWQKARDPLQILFRQRADGRFFCLPYPSYLKFHGRDCKWSAQSSL